MRIALTRAVSPSIARCELTHLARQPIDLDLAHAQHRQYEQRLESLGCQVQRLPAEPDLPDSVFVEDAAIVLEEVAILTRPGAESRQPEVAAVAAALQPYRPLAQIEFPATLDGGDVLLCGQSLYVGLSSRSNPAGIEQLRALVEPLGYRVKSVEVRGCLHLKSAATLVSANTLLVNPDWVDEKPFGETKRIAIDPAEPFAANALLVGETVVFPAAYPGTRQRLESHGIQVVTVDVSELAKAEGGVTCCSLIFSLRANL